MDLLLTATLDWFVSLIKSVSLLLAITVSVYVS